VTDPRPTRHLRGDLDHRVELVSMDRHFADITVALYLTDGGIAATVHSYSDRAGADERLDWLAGAMGVLGGMDVTARSVRFACGSWHDRAVRRVFLEACKVDPSGPPLARPLQTDDTRTHQAITVTSLGEGAYQVSAVAEDPAAENRAPAVAAGLVKLGELIIDDADATIVRFPCGTVHDPLVGTLLPRAINVRATLREAEMAAGRGVLVSPSAQAAAPS
jgi:hypothetical protein